MGDNVLQPADTATTATTESGWTGAVRAAASTALKTVFGIDEKVKEQQRLLKTADSYEEYEAAAAKLDELQGLTPWKDDPQSDIYDWELVQLRTRELREAREQGDVARLLFLVRTGFERNLGNMGDSRLYEVSHTGTKRLIEEYIVECEEALRTLLEEGSNETTLDTLVATRKAYGHTALVLSGGSILGILHTGVMHSLLKQRLLPRIISGSSAGSIFASILCVHFDYEIEGLFERLIQETFDIFEETGNEESVFVRLARFLKHGTILDNKYLAMTMQRLLGDLTFQEAYNRTRKILNVTVSPASIYESARLLNYLTAPNVLIWSAVCASCSVPFIFSSYTLLAKDSTTGEHVPWSASPLKYIDGSVDNDLPLTRLSELFNVDHFIACQVNPHVAPLLHSSRLISGLSTSRLSWLWHETQTVVRDEFSHYLLIASELSILKNVSSKMRSLLTQQYTGDITIVPDVKASEMVSLFKNPTTQVFLGAFDRGARATWPQMGLIRNHCAVELALDKTIHKLRGRMIPTRRDGIVRSNGRELGRKLFYSTANINGLDTMSASAAMTSVPLQRSTSKRHSTNGSIIINGGQDSPAQKTTQRGSVTSTWSKSRNHVRHNSEGLSFIHVNGSSGGSGNGASIKRNSSQDLAKMFNIGTSSPTVRTAWSPSVSRKNSFKTLKQVTRTKSHDGWDRTSSASAAANFEFEIDQHQYLTQQHYNQHTKHSKTFVSLRSHNNGSARNHGGAASPGDSACSSTTVSAGNSRAASRRTSMGGQDIQDGT